MMLIMAVMDMLGVASILPFMTVLSNPDIIETNLLLNQTFEFSKGFGIETREQFIFFLGIVVFILLISSLAFKALTTYAQIRFVQMRDYSLSKRFLEGYLHQPYSWFLNRNSADISKNILSEVPTVVGNCIHPIIELTAKGMVIIAMITLLVIIDSKLAIIVGLSLSCVYAIIYYFSHNYLNILGKQRLANNKLRFIAINEAFGAAKEVKFSSLENVFIDFFSNPAYVFAKKKSIASFIAVLPRFALEAIAFGGILLLILYLINQTGSFNNALPIVSLYVFAGYRLLPAIQTVYSSLTQLTFHGPSIDKLYYDLKNLSKPNFDQKNDFLHLDKEIKLVNVSYRYPNSSRKVLQNVSLTIPVRSVVGFVGTTGSGKSTIADILLGLLEPQQGNLEIDGKKITKQNVKSWQKTIGYVPQNIYLTDSTIESNIAFGIKSDKIDMDLLKHSSKTANLDEFITNELSEKYQTIIGERGIRLSGGQKQRLGIARALYRKPKILILDEATSALDSETEKKIMEKISDLRKNMTIIMIAHRLTTLSNCDKIFILEKGKIKNEISYKDLMSIEKNFFKNKI